MSDKSPEQKEDERSFDPLIMFPASKNFEIGPGDDPLSDLLNEFKEFEDPADLESDICYENDRLAAKILANLGPRESQILKLVYLLEQTHYYISEIEQSLLD